MCVVVEKALDKGVSVTFGESVLVNNNSSLKLIGFLQHCFADFHNSFSNGHYLVRGKGRM